MEERQSVDLIRYRAGLESALPQEVTKSDAFVTLDTGILIFDIDGKRIQITDFIMDLTEAEIKSLLAPLPKFYFSSDTHRVFRYVNDTCYPLDCRDETYTTEEIDAKLATKSDKTHNHDTVYSKLPHTHDDRYYTETEMNAKLAEKSDTSHTHSYAASNHNHDSVYIKINNEFNGDYGDEG